MARNIRDRIETWFERFAAGIFRHRFKALVVMGVLIAALLSQLPKTTIDTSTEGFLHETDPALVAYNAFRDQFGRDEVIIIAIERDSVFELKFLETLRRFHRDLEDKVPHVDEVTSLINARNTRGNEEELIVEDLLETWPETPESLKDVQGRAMVNPIYRNLLLSEDGRFTTIIIRTHTYSGEGGEADVLEGFGDEPVTADEPAEKTFLTDRENSETIFAVKDVVDEYRDTGLTVYLAGSPVVTHFLKQSMMTDMRRFMAMAIVAVGICLFLMFRRISGVVLPMVVVILSLLSTIAIMAITGTPIKVPTQILPSFLLAVGVGTSVHILAMFYHHFRQYRDKEQAIVYAMGHSGLAVVMTNVTTATGLMSFSTADVAPIADLGMFAGIGVLLAFVYTVTLLPALLAVVPIKKNPMLASAGHGTLMDRLLEGVARFSTSHPRTILVVSLLVIAASIFAATGIRFSHYPLNWFPEGNAIRVATSTIDHRLQGSMNLEMVIDTGKENGLYDPDLLRRLDKAASYAETTIRDGDVFIGKAWSVTTILKEIHQALNENRSEFYTIPDNRDLIAQEFLLFENSGSDDLEDFVDSQFSKARFTMKAPFTDAVRYTLLINGSTEYFETLFPEATVNVTGMIPLLAQIFTNSIYSLARSYTIALVIISALMVILIGRLRIGLLSMLPNLAPILLTMGVIYVFGYPMDLFTMLVASIGIGLAVDDTIHFMHNYRRYYDQTGDPVEAVRLTLLTAGRAMLVTTIVLAIGFYVLAFSTLNNIHNFGVLTGFTIIMALLADYLLAPALMVLVSPRKAPQSETVVDAEAIEEETI